MKNQAIVVRKYGGPSVLKLENTEIDEPGRNEIFTPNRDWCQLP